MECNICIEVKDGKDFTILPCKHELCNFCYDKLNKISNLCPYCRKQFRSKKVIYNFIRYNGEVHLRRYLDVTLPSLVSESDIDTIDNPL